MPLAEQRLAAKILDSGLLIPLGGDGLREMAGQQAQQAVMAGALAPDQFVQGAMAIERGMEPVMAEVREAAIKGLVDAYNVRELKMLAEFFATKTGDDVRAKIGPALEPSQVLMNERAQEAMGKALERLKAAWPEAGAAPLRLCRARAVLLRLPDRLFRFLPPTDAASRALRVRAAVLPSPRFSVVDAVPGETPCALLLVLLHSDFWQWRAPRGPRLPA